jgi:hypothetical protein
LGEQAAGSAAIGGVRADGIAGRPERNFLACPPLTIPVARAVDNGMVGNRRKPAQETAGRLVREAGNIAEGTQTGFLYEVFHLAELARVRAQLVVNQHSQAPPMPFEGERERLFVAVFGLLQQSESGCWRLHTSQGIVQCGALGTS